MKTTAIRILYVRPLLRQLSLVNVVMENDHHPF